MKKTIQALLAGSAFFISVVQAQAPAPPATLNQLMRGTLYPESNVVFAAQDVNPADVPRAKDPNMATDLLTSSFGKWEAVENSALAIAEVANLLSAPGRKCANGVDVPVQNADWSRFVEQMKQAGMAAYTAAQAKNQDKIIDATDLLTRACQNCHFRYRDRRGGERCK